VKIVLRLFACCVLVGLASGYFALAVVVVLMNTVTSGLDWLLNSVDRVIEELVAWENSL
jgi:hypothetical protein